MGQQDVCDFLEENPHRWYTSRDISDRLAISIGSVTVTLRKLREHDELLYRPVDDRRGKRRQYQYRYKE